MPIMHKNKSVHRIHLKGFDTSDIGATTDQIAAAQDSSTSQDL